MIAVYERGNLTNVVAFEELGLYSGKKWAGSIKISDFIIKQFWRISKMCRLSNWWTTIGTANGAKRKLLPEIFEENDRGTYHLRSRARTFHMPQKLLKKTWKLFNCDCQNVVFFTCTFLSVKLLELQS